MILLRVAWDSSSVVILAWWWAVVAVSMIATRSPMFADAWMCGSPPVETSVCGGVRSRSGWGGATTTTYVRSGRQQKETLWSDRSGGVGRTSRISSSTTRSGTTSLPMCICIHCSRVTDCAAYHFVEERHGQPHMTDDPTFEPRDGSPTIEVNIRTNRNDETAMARLWSEHEEQQRVLESRALEEDSTLSEEDVREGLKGDTVYDLSVRTTYEYDVVKCEDYVYEEGSWVKNMPEEIRMANPDFVPT